MAKTISVATEYTKTPGGRLISEGPFSGEDFRKKILLPAFIESVNRKEQLIVNLDGGYGYATSFLEEAFGGLVRETENPAVADIDIISEEEPALVEKIRSYISEALERVKS